MSAPPRYFIDFTVPARSDGSLLRDCREPDDYKNYVHWLADYLHTAELPLSAAQEAFLGGCRWTPEDLIFHCSDSFGYDLDTLEGIDNRILEGVTYQEYKEELEPYRIESNEGLEDEHEKWSVEDFLGISEAGYNARIPEVMEQGELPYWSHADIPFRSLLCRALRQIPSHEVRYKEMDFYFTNFCENASK